MGTTDIALDDIEFVNCRPDYIPENHYNLTCDFETDMCGWYQEQSNDDFDWYYGQAVDSLIVHAGPGEILLILFKVVLSFLWFKNCFPNSPA